MFASAACGCWRRLLLVGGPAFLGVVISITGLSQDTYAAGREGHEEGRTLKLAIPDFENVGGNREYDSLKRSLPEMIGGGLVADPQLGYMERRLFWQLASKRYPLAELRRDNERIFNEDILDDLKVDLILHGKFLEYRGKIRLDGVLKDRIRKRRVEITARPVDAREIFRGVSEFVAELRSAAAAFATSGLERKLGFLCFENRSSPALGKHRWLAKSLPIAVLSYLDLHGPITVIPWADSSAFCDSEGLNVADAALNLGADILVFGEYRVAGPRIVLTTSLYLSDLNRFVVLPEADRRLDRIVEVQTDLATDLSNVVDALTTESGDWSNVWTYFGEMDYAAYMEHGQELAQDEDALPLAGLMFARAAQVSPDSAEAHAALGGVRLEQARLDEAVISLSRAIELEPDVAKFRRTLGQAYLSLGEYRLARDSLMQAKSLDPRLPEVDYYLGVSNFFLNDFEHAIEDFEEALRTGGDKVETYVRLGAAYEAVGNERKALAMCDKALSVEPGNSEAATCVYRIHLEQGQRFRAERRLDEALAAFDAAARVNRTPEIDAWRLSTLNEAERFNEAVEVFEDAKRRGEPDTYTFYAGGVAYKSLERYEEALRAFDESLKRNPRSYFVLREKAYLYSEMGEAARGMELFDRILEQTPDDAQILFSKGWLLRQLGEHEKALSTFQQGLEVERKNADLWRGKAGALNDLGRYEEALEAYDKAIELDPTSVIAHNNKAWALTQMGRFEEAAQAADRALELNEHYGSSLNHKGYSLYSLGDRERGMALMRRAIEVRPNYGGTYFNLARIYAKEGKTEESLRNLEKAIERGIVYRKRALSAEEFTHLQDNPTFERLTRS